MYTYIHTGNFLPDPAGNKAGAMPKVTKKKPPGHGQNQNRLNSGLLQCVPVRCRVLPCAAVCCRVWQYAALCCSAIA